MPNNKQLTKFTIFGERNSGTKYLYQYLSNLILLKFTNEYGFKHWYIKDEQPRGIPNTTTDNECFTPLSDSDDTLFVVIVRNPFDWVGSMFYKPFYIPNANKDVLYEFATQKYESYLKKKIPIVWKPNRNHKRKYFMEEADNIIQLRNMKNNHFASLQRKVKHFYLIRQETLEKDIQNMIQKFQLPVKKKPNIPPYLNPRTYKLDKRTIEFIQSNTDNCIDNIYYTPKNDIKK